MNFQDKKQYLQGFTMIELVITIAILSFGIIGVYSAFYPASMLTQQISLRLTASYLAEEGFEVVRNIRDNNFLRQDRIIGASFSDTLLECEFGCQVSYKTGTLSQGPLDAIKPYADNNYLKIGVNGLYGYSDGLDSQFKRKVTVTQISKDVLKVTVSVMWKYNEKPFSFETMGYLYNWY